MNRKPDYEKYSLQELYEAAESVDTNLYPERAREIRDKIQLRLKNPREEDEELLNRFKEVAHQKEKQSKDWKGSLVSAVIIFIALVVSIFSGKLVTRRHEISFEDNPMLFYFVTILFVGFIGYLLIKADEQYGKDKGGDTKD